MSVLKYVSLIMPNSRIDKLNKRIEHLETEREEFRKQAILSQIKLDKLKLQDESFESSICVIVDSVDLYNLLYECITPLIPMDSDYSVYVHCVKNRFWFGVQNSSIDAESNVSCFSIGVKLKSLRNLFKIDQFIYRQQLTISFDSYGYINIHNLNI